MPQERIRERVVEQFPDVPVPQIKEGMVLRWCGSPRNSASRSVSTSRSSVSR